MSKKVVIGLAAVGFLLAFAGSAGAQLGQGSVLIEEWYTLNTGHQVTDNVDTLHAFINAGNAPNKSYWATKLDRPDGGEDYWGARMRGYIIPPETGDYTFWTASDDDSEVWLSTDDNPANAKMICNVEGWMDYQNWAYNTGAPGTTYKSAPISLQAGQRYYVDVFFSDGTGGGFDTVAWGGPGIGAGPVVVDGKYLAAFIRSPEPLFKAQNPDPADGAKDVTSPLFQWTAGATAVMHEVYMGTNPNPGAAEFMGPWPTNMYFHIAGLTPGKTYYWRVDEIDATGAKITGDVWSFRTQSLEAHDPTPADKATDILTAGSLKWVAGQGVTGHTVYLSADKALVEAGDAGVQVASGPDVTYDYAGLQAATTYYWRVDEIVADGTVVPGPVWSFTTADWILVSAEQRTLNYNNTLDPFISQLEYDVAGDLTQGGVGDLVLRFQGQAVTQGSVDYDAATGTYTVAADGADVWGSSDQFTYAYKALEGDGEIVARVVSNGTGSNAWAKGGVMIRETLDANSKHLIVALTGGEGGGIAFQGRPTTGGNSSSFHGEITAAPPYWVKLVREGDTFTAYCSADGNDWQLFTDTAPDNSGGAWSNPITVAMAPTVFIGLAVTSHAAGEERAYTLDNVSTTGNVVPAGPFLTWEAFTPNQNDPAPLYVALEDQAGQMAMVTNPNPAAVNTTVMDLWRIPLSAFAGVDLTNAATLYIGVGDGTPDGSGVMKFADIRIVKPVMLPDPDAVDVTMPGDPLVGLPNDGVNAGGSTSGWPAAEAPANAIDDKVTTKFLHFKGEVEPTGFAVTPSMGATVVTGLTFTTANDASARDPVAWELYGSNLGIDGPWVLIAKGAIEDFARPIDWPRRWKNVTPIGFANGLAFLNYKVSVTAVKNPGSANSMQIAEVELLGVPAAAPSPQITWVSFHGTDAPSTAAAGIGFTEAPDKGYTDLLKANGYAVGRYLQTGSPNVAAMNASSLVIISRSVASSSFQNAAADTWNGVTAPMIVLNSYTARKSRMGFNTGTNIPDTTGDIMLTVKDPAHPIFAGIALTGDTMTNPYAGIAVYPTDGTKAAGLSIVTDPANAEGTVLATVSADSTTGPAGAMVIAEWQAGATLTHDGGAGTNVLGGHRLVFLTGSRENGGKTSETAGMYDLAPDGAQMFLNAVQYMLQ
jgi:hypothetical protein